MSEAKTILITQAEAAKMVGASVNHFRTFGIPYIQRGRWRRYDPETVRQWIKDQQECPASASSSGKARTENSPGSTARKSASDKNKVVRPISEALALLTKGKPKLSLVK